MKSFFDHTREILAMLWTCAIIYFLWYCITHYGNSKEIITWILAYLAGVSSAILGAYYSINTHKPPTLNDLPDNTEVHTTTTSTTVSKPNADAPIIPPVVDTVEVKADNVNVTEDKP